jgi:hypothetical protein
MSSTAGGPAGGPSRSGAPEGGSSEHGSSEGRRHTAGAFDVRNVIAALVGSYGIILVVLGLVADDATQKAKTGGVDANLWAGIVMLVVALAFALWTRLRPVVVDPGAALDGEDESPPGS